MSHYGLIKESFYYLIFEKSNIVKRGKKCSGGFIWSSRRSVLWSRDRWLSVSNFFYNFYVPKTLNAFFSKQRFCARRARFLEKFLTDYFQIFHVYSKHKYLWSDEEVCKIFNFIIDKLINKKQKKSIFEILCLNWRNFVI